MSQRDGFTQEARLATYDAALAAAIGEETARQEAHIELIASENYASRWIMEAQGTQLTNKYAEGYPGKRYYGGCEFVDKVEALAIERACDLFGADYANVQPHSGAQANAVEAEVRDKAAELCARLPVYADTQAIEAATRETTTA